MCGDAEIDTEGEISEYDGESKSRTKSDIIYHGWATDINNAVMYDSRLWYYVLKSRSSRLQLNIEDDRIKRIVHNEFSKTRDSLLEVNEAALLYFLILTLNNLGYPTGLYQSMIVKDTTPGCGYHSSRATISEGTLENITEKYRESINELKYRL